MIRIAHIADIHLSERVHFESTKAVLVEFVEHVERAAGTDEPFDLALLAGDLGDPRYAPARATPPVRNFMTDIVRRLANVAPVVGVRGNHDYVGDWRFLNHLDTTHPVRWVDVEFDSFSIPGLADVTVHAIPWASPAAWQRLGAAMRGLGPDDDPTEAAVEMVFGSIGSVVEETPHHLHIGVGHMHVAGGRLPNGQELVGPELDVPWHALASARCNYFALGHLHSYQKIKGSPSWYAGSPNRLNYGEAGKPSGFLDVTVTHDETFVRFEPLWSANVMHTVDVTIGADGDVLEAAEPEYEISVGHHVRLRVRVPEGVACEDVIAQFVGDIERSGATAHVERIVLSQLRAREGADDVAKAPSIDDKLDTYLRQRGVGDDQRDRVLARFERLQEGQA